MRRREFIKVIAGSAAVWPLAAVAQAERVRKIGVLISTNENDVEGQARAALFRRGLCPDKVVSIRVHWRGQPGIHDLVGFFIRRCELLIVECSSSSGDAEKYAGKFQ